MALAVALVTPARSQTSAPPPVTVLQNSGGLANGLIFIGPQDVSNAPIVGPEILNDAGRMIWFMPLAPGYAVTDFRVQTYQGQPVLTWIEPTSNGSPTVDYIMDATYHILATVQASGFNADEHEFQLTPQNTALIDIYNTVPADLSSVGGPVNGMVTEGVVQEIDVATGKVLFEWHSLANVPVTESHADLPASGPYDYFHMNSVKLDTDGNLLISSRHTWTVYKVNRTTGAIIWRLGGKKSDFALGAGLPFAWQHDAEAVDASTLRLFDNESNGTPVLPYSRALFVHHDDTAMTASVVQALVHPSALSALAEGSAQSLDNGDTFVEWGILGRFSEFNAAGQLIYDVAQAPGYGSYRGFRYPWTGTPTAGPTVSVIHNDDGTDTVHAVWNGATQVASWEVLTGDSTQTLTIAETVPWNGLDTPISMPGSNNTYQVVALDASGATLGTSDPVMGPFADAFMTDPSSQIVTPGSTVVLTAAASGPSPSYQWFMNGTPLSDGPQGSATLSGVGGSSLVISGTDATCVGSYTCVATVLGNPVTSDPATITLSTAEPGRLIDASCRGQAGPGESALIIGFAVGGQKTSGALPVLVRAAGPTLNQFGVTGALADPLLELVSVGQVIASNNGWKGGSALASAAAVDGAFQFLSTNSLDSALATTLAGGTYTAVINGASGDSGIALGEIYDSTTSDTRVASTPELVNISGRAGVTPGGGAVIAGFVIGGSTSKTVLIRTSGPALTGQGVQGVLPDPTLSLSTTSASGSSYFIASNTGWGGNAAISTAASAVGAFPWTSAASADSALLVTLAPGAYTAVVSGASGDSGITLVEVYEVP